MPGGGSVTEGDARVEGAAVACHIEASSSYRRLYDLLDALGAVVLAHPLRLRAIVTARAKTDNIDARLLVRLLGAGLVPASYVPPKPYAVLREVTRARARLVRGATLAKNHIHALLRSRNLHPPQRNVFSKAGSRWLRWILVQAAVKVVRKDRALGNFHRRVRRRSGKNRAACRAGRATRPRHGPQPCQGGTGDEARGCRVYPPGRAPTLQGSAQ